MSKKPTYEELELRILELERTESEFKRSKDEIMKFRVIADKAEHGNAIVELDGTIVYLNDFFAKMHGYTPEELTGKNLSIFHNEKQLVDVHRINENLIKNGYYNALEVWHTHKDGTEFPMLMNAVIIHDDNGVPMYLGATGIDFTKHKRAETLLCKSLSNLLRAQYIAKMGDFTWELSSGAVSWSEGMHKLLKYDLNEKIDYAKINSAIHHPDDLESVTKWLNESIASGKENIAPKEYRLICKDGEVLEVKTEGQIEYKDGEAVRLFGICQDITKRKRSEERLRESEEKHRLLFESMVQGVVYQNATGSIISANPAAEGLLGLSLDQMCGRKSIDPHWKAIHEDGSDFPGETHPAMVALKTGEPVKDVIMGIYNPVKENHNWIKVNAIPQFKSNGNTPCQVFTTFDDITESRLTERALKNNQNFLDSIIDQSPFATWISDNKGTIIKCNAALTKLLNITDEQLIGKYNVFEDEIAMEQGLIPKIRSVFEDGKTANFSVEWDAKDLGYKDSNKVHIEGTMFPIHDDKGNLTNVVNHWIDVTQRKQAEKLKNQLEAQLQQAQKMEAIGTLAGGIAHDFNNILAAILGYAEMARDDCQPDTTVAEDLNRILEGGSRAKDLVQQILAFSRQDEMERVPLQPASVVKKAIKMLRPSLPTTIEINQDITSTTSLVLADPTQIHQIVMNLCTNAFHAMEETGGTLGISLSEITLSTKDLVHESNIEAGIFVQLSICDSGPGIAEDIKKKIYDPYFTTKETGKGTGMGLAIVHGIVKSYGGFISFYSEPGEGTAFHVFLPVIEKKLSPEIEDVEPIPIGRERILFIDDEEILAEMGKSMLERLGYHVTVRNNSIEALETFQNQPDLYDLVITDQTMPGMTGADIARRMIQIRPDIPIILCTGYSALISEKKAKSIGIKEFAFKPLSKKGIAVLIRKVLDNS